MTPFPASPVSRPSLADQAYDVIMANILTGQITGGDALIMDQLAIAFDISRTPVRDALRRLETEGLVEQRGRRGYLVRTVGASEVSQLYQAREAIEGYAARTVATLVAEPGGDAIADAIEAEIHAAQESLDGSVASAYTANRRVHRSIVAAVENRFLTTSFDSVWGVSVAAVAYGQLYAPTAGEPDLVAEHEPLLTALRSGDPSHAESRMLEHIRAGLAVNLEARIDDDVATNTSVTTGTTKAVSA